MTVRNVRLGHRDVQYPSNLLGELRASNNLLNDVPALRARLQEDGYLLLRNFIKRDTVLQARRILRSFRPDLVLGDGQDILGQHGDVREFARGERSAVRFLEDGPGAVDRVRTECLHAAHGLVGVELRPLVRHA